MSDQWRFAIAAADQTPGFESLQTHDLRPSEVIELMTSVMGFDKEERDFKQAGAFCSLNRTVLDVVGHVAQCWGYEDVYVWSKRAEALVPLTQLHDADWLAQFKLGDLLQRGELDDHDEPIQGGVHGEQNQRVS